MSDERITTKEASERLGISVGRIRQMVIAGDLPAEKFGRDLMIRVDDLSKVKVYGKPGRPAKNTSDDGQAIESSTEEAATKPTKKRTPKTGTKAAKKKR